jgi:RNA-binding protein
MITTKQRAYLRGLANSIDTILQIGKGGISDTLLKQVDDALFARELVKMRVLENAPIFAREAAVELAEKMNADVVQVIGTKFVLYRKNPKNPKIVLVK